MCWTLADQRLRSGVSGWAYGVLLGDSATIQKFLKGKHEEGKWTVEHFKEGQWNRSGPWASVKTLLEIESGQRQWMVHGDNLLDRDQLWDGTEQRPNACCLLVSSVASLKRLFP